MEVLNTIKEIEIEKNIKSLLPKKEFYLEIQKELTLFNALAGRINSIRKEIIKTQMRISSKNKFFTKL